MSRFIIADHKIDYLMPPSVEDLLNQDHGARFVVEVVDGLDLSNLVRQYAGRCSIVDFRGVPPALLTSTVCGDACHIPHIHL